MSGSVIEVTDSNFQTEAMESEKPVLVDFWATWCAPCKAMTPAIEQLASEMKNSLKVVKVNVEQSPQVAFQHAVTAVPTLVLIKDGQVVKRAQGAKSLEDLKDFVGEVLV